MRKVKILKLPQAKQGSVVRQFGTQTPPNDKVASPTSGFIRQGNKAEVEVNRTLRPTERDRATLEAEKGETVITNLNKDGIPEFYTIGGKRHYDGGTPLNLPPESFIYSRDRNLKITDPDALCMFDEHAKSKGKTPADLSKKYNLKKYRRILADPTSDKISIETAEQMIQNYNLKLGALALAQESKKGFPDGVPGVAMPFVERYGIDASSLVGSPEQSSAMGPGGAPDPKAMEIALQGGKFKDGGLIKFQDAGQAPSEWWNPKTNKPIHNNVWSHMRMKEDAEKYDWNPWQTNYGEHIQYVGPASSASGIQEPSWIDHSTGLYYAPDTVIQTGMKNMAPILNKGFPTGESEFLKIQREVKDSTRAMEIKQGGGQTPLEPTEPWLTSQMVNKQAWAEGTGDLALQFSLAGANYLAGQLEKNRDNLQENIEDALTGTNKFVARTGDKGYGMVNTRNQVRPNETTPIQFAGYNFGQIGGAPGAGGQGFGRYGGRFQGGGPVDYNYVNRVSIDGTTGAGSAGILKDGKPITGGANGITVTGVRAEGDKLIVDAKIPFLGGQSRPLGEFVKSGNGYKWNPDKSTYKQFEQNAPEEDKLIFENFVRGVETNENFRKDVRGAIAGTNRYDASSNAKQYFTQSSNTNTNVSNVNKSGIPAEDLEYINRIIKFERNTNCWYQKFKSCLLLSKTGLTKSYKPNETFKEILSRGKVIRLEINICRTKSADYQTFRWFVW